MKIRKDTEKRMRWGVMLKWRYREKSIIKGVIKEGLKKVG
jgi:hypothetical protein